jgi:hypothetical protein
MTASMSSTKLRNRSGSGTWRRRISKTICMALGNTADLAGSVPKD